jgi:microcystin-dependent protein
MQRTFLFSFIALFSSVDAQVLYPYNPDGDANGFIAAADLVELLGHYELEFSPTEVTIDGEPLTTVLTNFQNSLDSLTSIIGGDTASSLDMPLGTILPFASESVPTGWMLCDGREIAIEEYQGLYDLIGTTYGAGDSAFWAQVFFPATTFNIPDLRGRTIIGANDMGGEQSDILAIHQAAIGQVGGEEMHQLTEAEMPSHSHDFPRTLGSASLTTGPSSGSTSTSTSWQTNTAGGDQPHNNMQPYMALNYMMKVQAGEDIIGSLQNRIEELESQLMIPDDLAVGDFYAGGIVIKYDSLSKSGLCIAQQAAGSGQVYRIEEKMTLYNEYSDWRMPSAHEIYEYLGPYLLEIGSLNIGGEDDFGDWFWILNGESNCERARVYIQLYFDSAGNAIDFELINGCPFTANSTYAKSWGVRAFSAR